MTLDSLALTAANAETLSNLAKYAKELIGTSANSDVHGAVADALRTIGSTLCTMDVVRPETKAADRARILGEVFEAIGVLHQRDPLNEHIAERHAELVAEATVASALPAEISALRGRMNRLRDIDPTHPGVALHSARSAANLTARFGRAGAWDEAEIFWQELADTIFEHPDAFTPEIATVTSSIVLSARRAGRIIFADTILETMFNLHRIKPTPHAASALLTVQIDSIPTLVARGSLSQLSHLLSCASQLAERHMDDSVEALARFAEVCSYWSQRRHGAEFSRYQRHQILLTSLVLASHFKASGETAIEAICHQVVKDAFDDPISWRQLNEEFPYLASIDWSQVFSISEHRSADAK